MKLFYLLTHNHHLNSRLADGTVLEQILAQTLPLSTAEPVFITAGNLADELISAAVPQHAHVDVAAGTGNLAALRHCHEQGHLPTGECLVINDGSIVFYDYGRLASEQSADIVSLMDRSFWFRSGDALRSLLDWDKDRPLATDHIRPDKLVSVGEAEDLVLANRRLLGIGYASNDALERSYTEEFGVIPPVYIHPEAEIFSSMLGPYVSIGSGAIVENCVLENCIIDDGAHVKNLNLSDSIVGRNQKIIGKPQTILKL